MSGHPYAGFRILKAYASAVHVIANPEDVEAVLREAAHASELSIVVARVSI